MLYTDDAGVVWTSPRGLIRMMDVIVVACQEFGLTASDKKIEAMHLWSHPSTAPNTLRIETAGQQYKQTTEFVYLSGDISESVNLDTEIKRCIGAAWASVKRSSAQFYDRRNTWLSLKTRLFKAEVVEAMLYGVATWTMRSRSFFSLRTDHHKLLLRIIDNWRKDHNRMGGFSRGPFPNASKRQFGGANLGSPGPLFGKVALGSQSESCLGGWRCKGPSEEVTGDVLGILPPEKPRGLRGGPAQR